MFVNLCFLFEEEKNGSILKGNQGFLWILPFWFDFRFPLIFTLKEGSKGNLGFLYLYLKYNSINVALMTNAINPDAINELSCM